MAQVNEFTSENGKKYLFAKKSELTTRKSSDYVGKKNISLAITTDKLAEVQEILPDEIKRLVDRWNIINVLLDAVKSGLGNLPIPAEPEVVKADKTASDFGVLLKDYADFEAEQRKNNADVEAFNSLAEEQKVEWLKKTFAEYKKDVYSEADLNIFTAGEKPKEKEAEKKVFIFE